MFNPVLFLCLLLFVSNCPFTILCYVETETDDNVIGKVKLEKTDDFPTENFQNMSNEENLEYETKEMRYRANLSIQVCPQENCNFSTKFSRFLKYHMDTKHPVLGEEKKFVCDACQAGFNHDSSLKRTSQYCH